MTVSVKCRACGALHEMGHCSPAEWPYCSSKCEATFNKVVDGLATGVPLDLVGARPGSRLWLEAEKELARRAVRSFSADREFAERQYLETRPRRADPVWKRYFS
jgi:hypothetical protein